VEFLISISLQDAGRGVLQTFGVEVRIDGDQTIWIKEISTQGARGAGFFEYEII